MEDKVYTVKAENRLVGIVVGLAFILVGVLLIVVLQNWLGAVVILPGLIALWAGLRPNKLIFTADAIVNQSVGTKRYPYSQIRRVRMVARRFFEGSKRFVQSRQGGTTVRVAVGSGRRYRMYPEIQIEGDFPNPLVLEMAYVGQLVDENGELLDGVIYRTKRGSRYDTQAVVQDILDRLPSGAEVDQAVQAYAATGDLPDVRTIPQENPRISLGSGQAG